MLNRIENLYIHSQKLLSKAITSICVTSIGVYCISNTYGDEFPSIFSMSEINGNNGFRVIGYTELDKLGFSVASAGDIDGDGVDDIIVGSPYALFNGNLSGSSYTIFGKQTNFQSNIYSWELSDKDGFRFDGTNSDFLGSSVNGIGDYNGDGFDDIILGAVRARDNGVPSGAIHLVLGSDNGFSPIITVNDLDGSNGMSVIGNNENEGLGWSSASRCDINNDGLSDIIVGSRLFSSQIPTANIYVIFGTEEALSESFNVSELNGNNGFIIQFTNDSNSYPEYSVDCAGDFNGDNIDDIVIGVTFGFGSYAYVIYGQSENHTEVFSLDDVDGSNGVRFDAQTNRIGPYVSGIGDYNRDGLDDIMLAGKVITTNVAYVIYGIDDTKISTINLDTLPLNSGFKIIGNNEFNSNDFRVEGGFDFNDDGFVDLLVGEPSSRQSSPMAETGNAYLVFGKGISENADINLNDLDGFNGIRFDSELSGSLNFDHLGWSISHAGDVNSDGVDDIIIGAPEGDIESITSGLSYVVFGKKNDTLFSSGFELIERSRGSSGGSSG